MDGPDDGVPPAPSGRGQDVDAPSDPRDALEKDPSIAKKLVGYAYKKTHEVARAKDAAQEAIKRALEGNGVHRWHPARKSLVNHLADIVDTVVANDNRRAAKRREEPTNVARAENAPDSNPDTEQKIIDAEQDERRERLAAEVMMRVKKDQVIPRMLELEQDGIGDAAEQARQLDSPLKEIDRARERLAYHRDIVLEQEKKKGGAP
jgi:DNA-directed RNA polymerase specialized sigma24 family protein